MDQKKYKFCVLFFTVFCFFSTLLPCQISYPVIRELSSRNAVFVQFMQDVEQSYKSFARGDSVVLSGIYVYTAQKGDTLLKIAARCTLPYETIAGINRIPAADADLTGKKLYLPTVAGLFIFQKPKTSFEYVLGKRGFDFTTLPCYTSDASVFYFAVGERLTATERAFFLDTGLRVPLPEGILSSAYGMRKSPITGRDRFHEGIDLAAPAGTPVLACKQGIVRKTGFDVVYGNYILLLHDNGSESFYAHLETVLVAHEGLVSRGEQIGKVGSTGASTGPHLHFEIRVNGRSENPGLLF